jgi:DNA-binding SARP family transcriptional activator
MSIDQVEETGDGGLFDQFPYGLAITSPDGRVERLNHKGRALLLAREAPLQGLSCCELICTGVDSLLGTGCMTRLALTADHELPEVRVDLDTGRLPTSAWVTAAPLHTDREGVLFHLRPGRPGDRRRRTREGWHGDVSEGRNASLRVRTLGHFSLETRAGPITGDWIDQRPGEVLKFLVCERRRPLASDQICDALWIGLGHEGGRSRLRYQIHKLREHLEPGLPHQGDSGLIRSRRGGYLFDTSMVWIDADEFEREARAGIVSFEQGHRDAAAPSLARAAALYRGDFLIEHMYAEWALAERERLRELATSVFKAQIMIATDREDPDAAGSPARRLGDLEPFDVEAQRLAIEVSLRRGRRGEALRRYEHLQTRLRRVFGADPDFSLKEVERSLEDRAIDR